MGQNKNNTMIHYLLWCTLTNRHIDIPLSFLVVGHTKFSPDWCFGLYKRLYKRTKVGSLKGVAEVANKSAECNFIQLVSSEDGTTIVLTFDLSEVIPPRCSSVEIRQNRYVHSAPTRIRTQRAQYQLCQNLVTALKLQKRLKRSTLSF